MLITCVQIDPDSLIQSFQQSQQPHRASSATSHLTPYSTRYNSQSEISKYRIPRDGAPADAVHQMLKNELDLDGRPNLNLARCASHNLQLHTVHELTIAVVSWALTWKNKLNSS